MSIYSEIYFDHNNLEDGLLSRQKFLYNLSLDNLCLVDRDINIDFRSIWFSFLYNLYEKYKHLGYYKLKEFYKILKYNIKLFELGFTTLL